MTLASLLVWQESATTTKEGKHGMFLLSDYSSFLLSDFFQPGWAKRGARQRSDPSDRTGMK